MGSSPMPTDAVVGALAGLPSLPVRMACPLCTVRAGRVVEQEVQVRLDPSDLPAILRATLPHWSAEDKAVVLRALLEERFNEARAAMHESTRTGVAIWQAALRWCDDNAPTLEETRDGM